ncbi:sensor histidine kinase [Taibaiella koreensis]|uniref:sensor histidine kinase n=1 Tax=Taibaiella koreensis TaxID=1268548 RepID=UPI000E59AFDA|nr:sensor histidine kinase [Taibaiella koreensis]
MASFKINKALKTELTLQRKTIFGNRRYLFHIAAWLVSLWYLCFNVFEDFSLGFRAGQSMAHPKVTINNAAVEPPGLLISLIGSVLGSIMVYFFLLYVIPYARHKKKRRYLWLGLILNMSLWVFILGIAGVYAGFTYGISPNGKSRQIEESSTVMTVIGFASICGVTAMFFFSLYYFMDLYDQQRGLNRYREVLSDKLRAETDFLKTQINPHFLFNTLNNIYSLTMSHSEDAVLITRQLKELMIYMLEECKKDTVPLSGEIAFLKNYINLEKVRNKQEQVDIQFQVTGDPGDKEIAPLLLVNFVENAFKHGVKAGISHAFVRINLLLMDNTLSLDMINSKPPAGQQDQSRAIKENSGIGIRNVQRRLAILYPGRHKLRLSESPKDYSVYLTLVL